MTQGTTYRLRLINGGAIGDIVVSIDNHTMTVIEVEGTLVEALEVDSLVISAGQRYSALVTADQPIDNYWLRATLNADGVAIPGFGVLQYAGAADQDPTSTPAANGVFLDTDNLAPLDAQPAPEPDVSLLLNITAPTAYFYINGITYEPTDLIPLLDAYLHGDSYTRQPGYHIVDLQKDQVSNFYTI